MKILYAFVSVLLIAMSAALAAPGAHGPNGEHLDAAGEGHAHTDAGPRIDAFSQVFELVGRLQGDELSILVDRYATNEPVLDASLEVHLGDITALARFHADHGDYALDDARMLEALAAPGRHALRFQLTAGGESAVLEGTLESAAAHGEDSHAHGRAHRHGPSLAAWGSAGVLIALVLSGLAIALARRQASSRE